MKYRFLSGLLGLVLFAGAEAGHLLVSLDDIVLLSQRGVSSKTIVLFLENRETDFRLDAESIDKLVLAGVSDEVIRYLLSSEPAVPASGYVAPGFPVMTSTSVYPTVAYVEPYPSYYYRPYYYGSSYAIGFSSYPYYWFGYSGAGHHGGKAHHGGNAHYGGYLAHNGHGGKHSGGGHNGHNRQHGNSGGLQHVVSKVRRDLKHGRSIGGQHGVSRDHRGVNHGGQLHTGGSSLHHGKDGQSHANMTGRSHYGGGQQAHAGTGGSHGSNKGGHSNNGGHSSRSGRSSSHGAGGGHRGSVGGGNGVGGH